MSVPILETAVVEAHQDASQEPWHPLPLRSYQADGAQAEAELARVSYRPSRPSDGHDDHVVGLALAVDAAKGIETRPRVARGHMRVE